MDKRGVSIGEVMAIVKAIPSSAAGGAIAAQQAAEAAQAAAEQVAESIPQDYSAMSAEVAELKSAIDFSLGIEKPLNYSTGTAYNASISPSQNVWNVASNVMGYIIPLSQVSEITIKSNATNGSIFAFLKTDNHVHATTPDYATGGDRTYIEANTTQTVIVPNDANYIYITEHLADKAPYLPQSVTLSTYIDTSAEIEEIEAKMSADMDIDVSKYPSTNRYISPSANAWGYTSGIVAYMVTMPNQPLTFEIKGNEQSGSIVAILADDDTTLNATPVYATGYTSRLFVPAGEVKDYILPSDARYIWIMMANATTDFSPVYAKVNYYVIFSDIENDLNALKSYHPNYSGKKLSILGDSISTFAVPSEKTDGKAAEGCTTNYPGNPVQYSNSNVTSVGSTWWGKVLNQFGMVLGINESWAGSTIGYNPNQTSGGKYTADNCLCSSARIGHLGENGTPDIIIVFGGTNDINHHRVSSGSTIRYAVGELDSEHNPYDYDNFPMITDTYYGSITTMLLRIQHTYPNATILMLLPYFCTYTHTSSGDIATPYDQNEWSKAAIDVCKYLGVEYLDLRTIINLYDVSSLLFDGLHPKANGMEAIAKAVIHKLNNML